MSLEETPSALLVRLRELARTPVLLVCCDYDGTLSPIVENPEDARPHRESVAALRLLASYPDTHVAVVSGRSLKDLAALSRLPDEIHLVGSHGSEFDAGFVRGLKDDQLELREEIIEIFKEMADRDPGFQVEIKPASVAFHYRRVTDRTLAEEVVNEIRNTIATDPGVEVKLGKQVVELAVVSTNKGTAIDTLRKQVSAEAVLFMGDDVTDEDGFATMRGPDVGVKIGSGTTLAGHRLSDTEDAARILALLSELRRGWLEGDSAPAIERHSLLSDQRTVALMTPDARVTWLCHPRPDSPAVFAELVGGPSAGYFSVAPSNSASVISQRYLPNSLVLETRWSDLTVIDYLDASAGRSLEPAGRTDLIRVLMGSGSVDIEFAPRLDFGRAPTQLESVPNGVVVRGANQSILLRSPGVRWSILDEGMFQTAKATVELSDEPLVLELSFGVAPDHQPDFVEAERRRSTIEHWSSWAEPLRLSSVAPADVLRSALTLKALVYEPSGAILAAATTSLPEVIGGVRNWDYRYCWPRDASMTAAALLELGSTHEATALLRWILDRVRHLSGPEKLRPLYALVGDAYLPEAVIPTLNGYRGSRPVRIGNGADSQVQLDVFGPIVDLIHRLAVRGNPIDDDLWQLTQDMVHAVATRWHEPDHGVWEERRPQRHHVHSRVMCWVAVDRAIKIAEFTERPTPDHWAPLRDQIAEDVTTNGWNEAVGAYTIAYGNNELDAAALWIGLSGLLEPDDPRFVSTVRAVERELRNGPTVYRYRLDDGLPGDEGGFLICTSWLIEAYILIGQLDDAKTLFERYCDLAGPTGLLSEEFDPRTETMLGNHPQAYSHLGLINAALAINRAETDLL